MLGKLQLSKPTTAGAGFHPTPCCAFPSPGEGSHPDAEAVVEAAGTGGAGVMAASLATSWKCLSDSSEGGMLQRVALPKGTDPESPRAREAAESQY